jgi:hypothetical protein
MQLDRDYRYADSRLIVAVTIINYLIADVSWDAISPWMRGRINT